MTGTAYFFIHQQGRAAIISVYAGGCEVLSGLSLESGITRLNL